MYDKMCVVETIGEGMHKQLETVGGELGVDGTPC